MAKITPKKEILETAKNCKKQNKKRIITLEEAKAIWLVWDRVNKKKFSKQIGINSNKLRSLYQFLQDNMDANSQDDLSDSDFEKYVKEFNECPMLQRGK
jgi:hypothetical protein